jgi:hypothetical protein
VEPSNLTQQGIDAYKAGNKDEAVQLLMQAVRENAQDENAWLYLGAAIDDPTRKRQAFQKVLAINPNNEKAQNALARLDAGATGATAGSAAKASATGSRTAGTATSDRMNAAGDRMKGVWSGKEGFAVPGNIQGAPATVTVPELISNAQVRAKQAYDIYTKQDYEQIVAAGQTATMWDSVFIAGVGVVALGLAELIGGLIGWPLTGFAGGLFGLLRPFLAAIVTMIATAAGFYGSVYASRWYLQNQNINVSLPQHSMYYALVFLPLTLVNALIALISNSLGVLILCALPILFVLGIALLIYGWILLKGAFDRVYGTDNNRGLITAAIAVIGGWAASGIVRFVLGGIFRV